MLVTGTCMEYFAWDGMHIEDEPCDPQTPYGRSKTIGTKAVLKFSKDIIYQLE